MAAADGPAAHLAADPGCRALVFRGFGMPWYWHARGPERVRRYPTAGAVACGPGDPRDVPADTCRHALSDIDGCAWAP